MMKQFYALAIGLVAAFSGISTAEGQGLVLNEFSNGPGGNQEFYEYVVVGPTLNPNCGPIDIRGWIIDDNNGDFSCGPRSGVGIAPGHVKFSSDMNWSAVPTGSIILVYNDAEPNPAITLANDPTDANSDLVYVVPITSPLLERNSGGTVCPVSGTTLKPMGCDASCPGTGTSAYLPATYVASSSWNQISMANSDDAAQVRTPTGAYFHGVGYGGINMNGGPDNIFFPGSGTGDYYALTNGTSTNFRLQANWSTGLVTSGGETPGFANSGANAAWIASLQVICPLPVTYAEPLTAYARTEGNLLEWATATEINTDYYEVLRAEEAHGEFLPVGTLPAAQQSSEKRNYNFLDANPPAHAYYRLAQVDATGDIAYSNTVEVSRGLSESAELNTWPNPAGSVLHYEVKGLGLKAVVLYDPLGRKVAQESLEDGIIAANGQFDLSNLEPGVYVLELTSTTGGMRKKVAHIR